MMNQSKQHCTTYISYYTALLFQEEDDGHGTSTFHRPHSLRECIGNTYSRENPSLCSHWVRSYEQTTNQRQVLMRTGWEVRARDSANMCHLSPTSGVSTKKECCHAQRPEEPPALAPTAHRAELQQATKSCPGKPQGQRQFLGRKTEVLPQRKNFCLQTTNINFFSGFLTCRPAASHELTP